MTLNMGVTRLTLSSSFARNSTNAACTSSRGGAGRFDVLCRGCLEVFGVPWPRACEVGADEEPVAGGAAWEGRDGRLDMFCIGVCMALPWGLTPFEIREPVAEGRVAVADPVPGPAPGPVGAAPYPFELPTPFAGAACGWGGLWPRKAGHSSRCCF
jgi:hypothetical protein